MVLSMFIGLIPVLLLLVVLLFLDSLQLVSKVILMACLLWGVISALGSFYINTFLLSVLSLSFEHYSGYVSPLVEEGLKAMLVLLLVKRGRIGFLIDGAIYGFAIGAAFAFSENMFYLLSESSRDTGLVVWITRGFGTAVMHGGASAVFAILCMGAVNKRSGITMYATLGFAAAVLIHATYNHFLVSPAISALVVVCLVPTTLILTFRLSEVKLRGWMELEFDTEVRLLAMLRRGQFSETRPGNYLRSLKQHFPAEVVVDLYCYVQLYLELSLLAKRNMMLHEQEMEVSRNPATAGKLVELRSLERSIGRAGVMALSPMFRMGRKELWKLAQL